MTSDTQSPPAVVVMGVSGSGKTTVGRELARALDVPFIDADDLHPQSNRDKMAGGTPLTDEDRGPWLRAVGHTIGRAPGRGRGVVVACSALRRLYRDAIAEEAGAPVLFAHLAGQRELIRERMEDRADHFMPPAPARLPAGDAGAARHDENGSAFSIDAHPADVAARIRDWATVDHGKEAAV